MLVMFRISLISLFVCSGVVLFAEKLPADISSASVDDTEIRTRASAKTKTAAAISLYMKLKDKIEDNRRKNIGFLDNLVDVIVLTLNIPLKKPIPISGKGLQFATQEAKDAWYRTLSSSQKEGLKYFSESVQYFDSEPEKALELLEKCLRLFPQYGEAIQDRNLLRYNLRKPGAEEPVSIRRSRECEEWLAEARRICFLDPEQALKFVQKAIRANPSSYDAYIERDLITHYIYFGEVSAQFWSEDIADRYLRQGIHIERRDRQKAIKFLKESLKIKPDWEIALKSLSEFEQRQADESFKTSRQVIQNDFSKGFDLLMHSVKLQPMNETYQSYLGEISDEIFNYGSELMASSLEEALPYLEANYKNQPANQQYLSVLNNLKSRLFEQYVNEINQLFLNREPDELKIIKLIDKLQALNFDAQNWGAYKQSFAQKLYGYSKPYFREDPLKALKIIVKVSELMPEMRGIEDDKANVLDVYVNLLVKRLRDVIKDSGLALESEIFWNLLRKLRVILVSQTEACPIFDSQEFQVTLLSKIRALAKELLAEDPLTVYNLYQLYLSKFPTELQAAVEMQKTMPLIADQYLNQALRVYEQNAQLSMELLLKGLRFAPEHPEIIRYIDYLRLYLYLD